MSVQISDPGYLYTRLENPYNFFNNEGKKFLNCSYKNQ